MPLVADRLRESTVVTGAMVATALLFAVYPLLPTAVTLGACSVLLGFALGSVQPMIMSMLLPNSRPRTAMARRWVCG